MATYNVWTLRFLFLGVLYILQTSAKLCVEKDCDERCGQLTTEGNYVSGICTLFDKCKCHPYGCTGFKCNHYCTEKNPRLYKSGHCRFDWCKCDVQAFRSRLSQWLHGI